MVAAESTKDIDNSSKDRVTLKVLIPAHVAGSIIGKAGEAIKQLKSRTKAHIKISGRDEVFPYTEERIVLVVAPSHSMMEAVTFIHAKLRSPENTNSKAQRNNKKRHREMKLIISESSAGKVIGKSGHTIQKIQEDHKVRVFLSSKDEWGVASGERLCTVAGKEVDVNSAIQDVLNLIKDDPYAKLNKSLIYPAFPKFDCGGYQGYPGPIYQRPARVRGREGGVSAMAPPPPLHNGYQSE